MANQTIDLEFRGAARVRDGAQPSKPVVPDLNREASRIARQITTDIRFSVPGQISVYVNIQFREGSIEWVGVVTLLTWMGFAGGIIQFVDYVTKVIQFSVDRVVREEITRLDPGDLWDFQDTSVTPRSFPRPPLLQRFVGAPEVTGFSRWLFGLTLLNSVLLLIVLIVMLTLLRTRPESADKKSETTNCPYFAQLIWQSQVHPLGEKPLFQKA